MWSTVITNADVSELKIRSHHPDKGVGKFEGAFLGIVRHAENTAAQAHGGSVSHGLDIPRLQLVKRPA